MNYTKGDWRRFGGMVDGYGIVSSNSMIIISQESFNGLENEANANLIAAAPDMYEALKELVEKYQWVSNWFGEKELHDKVFNALNKANGMS